MPPRKTAAKNRKEGNPSMSSWILLLMSSDSEDDYPKKGSKRKKGKILSFVGSYVQNR